MNLDYINLKISNMKWKEEKRIVPFVDQIGK